MSILIKIYLFFSALLKYKAIYPCPKRKYLINVFTFEGDYIFFLFNTKNGSSHLLKSKISFSCHRK